MEGLAEKPKVKPSIDTTKMKAPGYTGSGSGYAADTGILKTSPGERGEQVSNKELLKKFQPGNTIIHTGTQVSITEGNKNSPQVKGMHDYIKAVESGKSRAEAVAEARQKNPGFKLAGITAPGK